MNKTPNPGSDAAIEAGCTCPVLDNGHGKGVGGNGENTAGGLPLVARYMGKGGKNEPANNNQGRDCRNLQRTATNDFRLGK